MPALPQRDARFAPSASTARAVTALIVHQHQRDTPAVAIPRAETQLVVRFGPSARNGLDVHAMGPRQSVHRKLIRAGHWSVTARLGLGAQDRHLRRIFREALGVSPKTFAKLARFRRAIDAAREHAPSNWASIAPATGYYDQAHLIAEFRAIAGVTPAALVRELREVALP